jgi:hypothetical protein
MFPLHNNCLLPVPNVRTQEVPTQHLPQHRPTPPQSQALTRFRVPLLILPEKADYNPTHFFRRQ